MVRSWWRKLETVTAEAASIDDIRIKGRHGHLVLGRTEGTLFSYV
jgi:hypothetical protein